MGVLYKRRNVAHFVRNMRRFFLAGMAVWLMLVTPALPSTTNGAPDFSEVFDLVRTHLAGATATELNETAVEGFLAALRGKVVIVGQKQVAATNTPAVAATSLLESNVAYVRLAGLDDTTAGQIGDALTRWSATSGPAGLVLDLRFARSDDYAAAGAVADLFQSKVRMLIDWGDGVIRSKEKDNPWRLPVAVLVNRETIGAMEALAAVLRETGVGLILGNPTAGSAMVGREFPLKDGRKLRVAAVPVKVGDGVQLTVRGVQPDIAVAVAVTEEKLLLDDPYGLALGNGVTNRMDVVGGEGAILTNRLARRPRPNEADLVRARRNGISLDAEFADARAVEPAKPLIRDPVLARAVDLIKGLAVVRATRS